MKIRQSNDHWLSLTVAIALLLAGLVFVGVAPAQSPVEDGRRALSEGADYPWYDSAEDGFRRIRIQEEAEVSPSATSDSGGSGSWSFFNFFGAGDWFTPLAWIGIATLVGLIVFVLVRAFLARERFAANKSGNSSQDDEAENRDLIDRVEDLPVKLRRPTTNLLGEAKAQYDAGNYAEAIIYLYSHQLVRLDTRQLIRLTKGKTNRQYLAEIIAPKPLRAIVEQTMIVFEDVFFGRHSLSRNRFESIWNQLEEFNSLVDRAAH